MLPASTVLLLTAPNMKLASPDVVFASTCLESEAVFISNLKPPDFVGVSVIFVELIKLPIFIGVSVIFEEFVETMSLDVIGFVLSVPNVVKGKKPP